MNRCRLSVLVAAFGLAYSALTLADGGAIQHAQEQLRLYSWEARASTEDRFSAREVSIDEDGTEHVRMDRRYRGLRVIGGEVLVNIDASGRLIDMQLALPAALSLDTSTAKLSDSEALGFASSAFDGRSNGMARAERVIYARGMEPMLAYDVRISGRYDGGDPSVRHFIVDATQMRLLDQWEDALAPASASTSTVACGASCAK